MSSLRARKSWRTEPPEALEGDSEEAVVSDVPSLVLGRLVSFDGSGAPLVDFPANPRAQPCKALVTGRLAASSLGSEVALLFVDGDLRRPIIVGLVDPSRSGREDAERGRDDAAAADLKAKLDGERVVLRAENEIVLECGKSRLILTRSGKILLRGAYISSRSSGANRIMGGSVQLN